jgi:hypothetical protein
MWEGGYWVICGGGGGGGGVVIYHSLEIMWSIVSVCLCRVCVYVMSIGIGVVGCLMSGRRFWWKIWICAWWCIFEMKIEVIKGSLML